MITICAKWEPAFFTSEAGQQEWNLWRQIRGAFDVRRFCFTPVDETMLGVSMDQYATMQEALDTTVGRRVFLELVGSQPLSVLRAINPVVDDVVLIVGSSAGNNLSLIRPQDTVVRIDTPKPTDLYGINAASIALAELYRVD